MKTTNELIKTFIIGLSLWGYSKAQAFLLSNEMQNFRISGRSSANDSMVISAKRASGSIDLSIFKLDHGRVTIGLRSFDFYKGYFDLSTMSGVVIVNGLEIPVSMKHSNE